jgi:hypothetical protein
MIEDTTIRKFLLDRQPDAPAQLFIVVVPSGLARLPPLGPGVY